MVRRKPVERRVIIGERDLGPFLDMLRYDACTVVSWELAPPGHQTLYEVTLRSNPDRTPGFEFTVDRWLSFGIAIGDIKRRL